MRRRAGVLAVALTACTARTPVVDPTGTASPTLSPTSSPRPTIEPTTPVRAAVINDGGISLYEVATGALERLATGSGLANLSWLGPTELAVVVDGAGSATLRTIDTASRASTDVLTVDGDLLAYGFDRERTALATMVATASGFVDVEIRYLVGGFAVQAVTTMRLDGSDRTLDVQFATSFSPDGQRLLIVHTENASGTEETAPLQVRRLDGSLEYWVDSDRDPTEATWLPDGSLVFRSLDGVRRWKPGKSQSSALGDLSTWYAPWVGPNGRVVAYDTGRFSRRVQVRRVNVLTGVVTDIGPPGRANPVYAAGNEIWTQIVQRCRPDCFEPFVLGPIVYALNPNTGEERVISLPTLEGLALWSE
jgi:hypothetical protein